MAEITIGRVGFHLTGAVNIRIDRGSPLGNPFKIEGGATRDQVCDKYAGYLKRVHLSDWRVRGAITQIAGHVQAGHPVNLQCWCAPKRCHGEEIKRLVENLPLCGCR